MTFRLSLLLLFYQFMLGGASIFYFAKFEIKISVVIFFTIIIVVTYLLNHKVKYDLIGNFTVRKTQILYIQLMFLISVLFYIFKFYSLGIPLFERNANIARVEFARTYDFATFVFKNIGFVCIVYFTFISNRKWQVTTVIVFMVIGYYTGYRSATAFPLVLVIFVYFLSFPGSIFYFLKAYSSKILLTTLLMMVLLIKITAGRFGSGDAVLMDAAGMLIERIALVNYYNFERIERIFLDKPIYLGSILWDLESVVTSKLGFSGRVTQLTGFKNYETLQLTPTFLGEGYANFNNHLYLYSIPIIVTILLVIKIVAMQKTPIPFVTLFTWMMFLPMSSGMGLGSFIFNFTPKFIITLFVMYAFWLVFKYLLGGVFRRVKQSEQ